MEFAYKYRIDRLLQSDTNYHNTILQNAHNQFWRRFILGYTTFYTSIKNETPYQIELTPIWGNPDIQIEFNSALFRANVRFLQDLYRGNNRLTLKELIYLAQTTLPSTYYLSLWKSVPRESPIQGDRSGNERNGKKYEASGAGRNTAQRLGRYGRGMDPCAKICRPAH